jgi:hypothetical protein
MHVVLEAGYHGVLNVCWWQSILAINAAYMSALGSGGLRCRQLRNMAYELLKCTVEEG